MNMNVSSWGGLRPPAVGMPVSKNRTASFSRLLSNTQQDCKRASTTVLYLRTENTLYSGSLGGTQTVYAEYTPDSTEEDPVARIKGNDNNGEFDFICHINDIDPANASYAEMCALFGHLQKTGQIPPEASSCVGFNVLPCGINTGNVTQRMNYMTAINRMTTSQMFSESNRTAAKILLKMYQNFIDTKTVTDTVELSEPVERTPLQIAFNQLSDEAKSALERMKAGQKNIAVEEWVGLCQELRDAGVITQEEFSITRPDLKPVPMREPGAYWSPPGILLGWTEEDDVGWLGDPLKYLDEWMAALGKKRIAWAAAIGPDGKTPTGYLNELSNYIGACARVANIISNMAALA